MATYLSRTQSSSNQQIFTVSTWVKLGDLANSMYINNIASDANNRIGIFTFGNNMTFYGINSGVDSVYLRSTALYRDPSAWYHVVVSVDTTQATSSDRVKMYVNGERITAFDNEVYPTQNLNFPTNSTHYVGCFLSSNQSYNFYGVMSHYHYTDGYAYDASTFGESDANGVWTPKTSPSVTYGTNGFFLKFENSGSMGTDSSGNANNFTVNGNLTQTIDTPSNVYATFNSLYSTNSNTTFSNGNNTFYSSDAGGWVGTISTLGFQKGKWYWEAKYTSGNTMSFGVIEQKGGSGDSYAILNTANEGKIGKDLYGWGYNSGGTIINNNTTAITASSFTTGDIIQVAVDYDNGEIYFGKNGTWQNSGNPSTGTNPCFSSLTFTEPLFFATGNELATSNANFGNGYFGTTAVSSAGSNGNGSIFEYDVPSGYYALNTKNLATYG